MEALAALFPAENYTLLAFIVLLPLLGAIVNGVFGKRLGREAVTLMGLSVIFVSFVLSVVTFLLLREAQHEHAARFFWHGWDWATLSTQQRGSTRIGVNLSVDALSGTMALVVTGVGFLIHLYSSKYMEDDPGFYRFFAYLNLFIFSMLVLILGDNLPILFVGWEGVGLCSYLLIGFWFHEEKNASAGKKAFITNRIGDFGLLCAMGLLIYFTGALDWKGISQGANNLLQPVAIWPLGHHFPFYEQLPFGVGEVLNTKVYVSAATLVGIALFIGCAGKSAQLPLYVWLPDAMAGPTPVSALIHAATMVTAGVYLVCRLSFVFVLSPAAMFIVASIGALTALFAAIIAFAQNDIKKVLAYSTVSQLGYMFLGVGVGAFAAGFFHVLTHAFFKACLFLGAGSVIHAMHARIHDTDASQDMRNMGGLKKYLPYTFWTFAISWAAIVGFPLTSGFFSKDEILFKAFTSTIASPTSGGVMSTPEGEMKLFLWPTWAGTALYAIGLLTAVFTAFYMTRLFIGTFFGEFKGWKIVKNYRAAHGHDDHHHHHETGPLEGPKPHESPWQMWVPLAVLAALAAFAGFLNAPLFHLEIFEHWLHPVFHAAAEHVKPIEGAEGYMHPFVGLAVTAFAVGVGGAYWVYVMQKGEPARRFTEGAPGFHSLVVDKFRVDELYDEVVIGSVDSLADISVSGDKWVVDGILARFTAAVATGTGAVLRFLQTGVVHVYATFMVIGLLWLGWFLITPRAEAKTATDAAAGSFSVSAAPGLGYKYRWDANGDGQWDSEEFSDTTEVNFKLDVEQSRKVRLEVKNAFGRTNSAEFVLERPKRDASGASPVTLDVRQQPDGTLKAVPRGAGSAQGVKP